jgi:hypothetical protein
LLEHRDIHLLLQPEGESCVLQPDREPEVRKAGTAPKKPEDATYLALLPFGADGTTHAEWQAASKQKERTFNRHLKKLLEAKRIAQKGNRYSCVVALDDALIAEPD